MSGTEARWRKVRVDWLMDEIHESLAPEQLAGREVFYYSIPAISEHGDGIIEDGDLIASSKPRLRGGELLVSKLNPRKNHVLVARAPLNPTVCSGEFIVLRPRACDVRFMGYLFSSEAVRQRLNSKVQSVTKSHQRVSPEHITKMWVRVPSLAEQRAIADFLDRETARLERMVGAKRRVLGLLREKWIAAVSRLTDKPLWPQVALKRMLASPLEYGAGEPAEYDEPTWPRYIRTTDVTFDGRLRSETFKSLPPEVAAPYMLEEGDLLFTRSGATVGKTFLYRSDWGPACFAGYLIRARLDRSRVLPGFVGYFVESEAYWSQINLATLQSTIQNISADRYGEILVRVPTLSEQEEVVASLDAIHGRLSLLEERLRRQMALLLEHRQVLITAAVTGQMDIANRAA